VCSVFQPPGFGVQSQTGNNNALVAQNSSALVNGVRFPTITAFNTNNGSMFLAKNGTGALCLIEGNGSLSCTGSKSAIVPAAGGTRHVALYAFESPQNWFEDFRLWTIVERVSGRPS
jgi:hypothetical protein